MSSKHFRRKVKNPKFGFRYYRIWGHPLREQNVPYHQRTYGQNPDYLIFKHPVFGWLTLYVCEEFVKYPKFKMLCGALAHRYFNKKSAALRVLDDYKTLRTTAGLHSMCDHHHEMDLFDEAMGICDRGLGGYVEPEYPEDERG
jgi:hypothetical protein